MKENGNYYLDLGLRVIVPLKQIESGVYGDLFLLLVNSIMYLLKGSCRYVGFRDYL